MSDTNDLFSDSYCGLMAEPSVLTASGRDDAASRKAAWENFDNSGDVPLHVPGFTCPIDYELDVEDRFMHGINEFEHQRLLLREVAMLAVIDAITDKFKWHRKIFDNLVVARWKKEALRKKFVSPAAWEWCFRELREKATFFENHGFVTTLDTNSVCAKADGLVSNELRRELMVGTRPLRPVKGRSGDWHPRSNRQLLNLIDPSLFPLVYGRTTVLQSGRVGLLDCLDYCGKGDIAPKQTVGREHRHMFSPHVQWLPAEVKFKGAAGTDVEFTSYINNLHPGQHQGLYSAIAKIVSLSIPMWNSTLVKSEYGRVPVRFMTWNVPAHPSSPPSDLIDGGNNDGDHDSSNIQEKGLHDSTGKSSDESFYGLALAKVISYLEIPDHPSFDERNDDHTDEHFKSGAWKDALNPNLEAAVRWKFKRLRDVKHPEPGENWTYEEWKAGKSELRYKYPCRNSEYSFRQVLPRLNHEYQDVCLERDFREKGLQIIVKMAGVELSPEKPEYGGGSWHLEVSRLLGIHCVWSCHARNMKQY